MIKNDDDLANTFIALQKVFQAENDTPQADKQDVLFALIEQYKRKYTLLKHPIYLPKLVTMWEKLKEVNLMMLKEIGNK